jgi:hypothetical protein
MSSKNLDNFSFQQETAKKGAQAAWTNHRIPRPLNLQQLRGFTVSELHNPYTKEKWLEMAAAISETQLTTEQLQSMDYDNYRRLCLLLKEAMLVAQADQKILDDNIAIQSTRLEQLKEKELKLTAEELKNRQSEK